MTRNDSLDPLDPLANLAVIGLSYTAAPADVVERLLLTPAEAEQMPREIASVDGVDGVIVLSTCSRLEIYVETLNTMVPWAVLRGHIATRNADPAEVAPYVYLRRSADAVEHLFAVAGGLDSIALGEDQIIAQLKGALRQAQRHGTDGHLLHHLMQVALHVAKRVRTETTLNATDRSLISVGLQHIKHRGRVLGGASALVVGAGSMGAIATAALRREGVARVDVANRTMDRANRLAATAHGRGVPLAEVPAALAQADVVICCTSAVGVIIDIDDVTQAVAQRAGRHLTFLDIAAPRNVGTRVAEMAGVSVVTLAHLADDANDRTSQAAVLAASHIVELEVAAFHRERREARASRAVSALRETAATILAAELAALARRMPELDERTTQELTHTLRRVADKLVHAPSIRARAMAGKPDGATYTRVLNALFAADSL